jgi:Protein of unknown function (DUF3631)
MTDNAFDFDGNFDEPEPDPLSDWLRQLSEAHDEEELFALLALQRPPKSRLARQQIRGRLLKILSEQFKAHKSGASAAKTADAWLREGEDEGETLQGREYRPEPTEPWKTAIDPAEVLDEVARTFETYVYASREVMTVFALWTAYTHCFDAFGVSPILDVSSPTKRCGKSTGVVVARHLTASPLLSGNITAASLFRAVEAWKPTLLIDEADTFLKMADELRGILNAGHTRDTAFVVRSEGDQNEPRIFSTWAPKLVAAIGRLPETIEDRSIRVVLARKPTAVVKADAFDPVAVREACADVRRRIVRFVLDHLDEIASAQVERPDKLHDRAWNNWRPLFAVASVAGPEWEERCLSAAIEFSGGEEAGDDFGVLLLRHVWEAMGSPAELGARISTFDLIYQLVTRDDAVWAKWWARDAVDDEGRKRVASAIAYRLKPFGIGPEQLWIDESNVRGYQFSETFEACVRTYLDLDARDARDARDESSSQAIPSDPSVSSVLFEAPRAHVSSKLDAILPGTNGSAPLPGDDDFLDYIAVAVHAGHITTDEALERERVHVLVTPPQEPRKELPF